MALRDAFPDVPLRLDPNTAWSVATSIKVGAALEGVLEYLEDPTPGLDGHGRGGAGRLDAARHQHVRGGVR